MVTDADKQAAREFLRSRGKSAKGSTPQHIHKGIGCGVETARELWDALKAEEEPEHPEKPKPEKTEKAEKGETHERTADSWTVEIPKTRIHTLEQLLDYCDVNADEWEVERFVVNKWEVGAKNAAKQIEVEPLYQVKAWLKKKVAVITARQEIDALLAKLERRAPIYPIIKAAAAPTGNALEISMPDAHLGKLAWGRETGWENYDTRIAENTFRNAFAALLQRTSGYKFDRVLLVPGNDYLNANGTANATANGTPQSCDGRHQKTFEVAEGLTIWTIEQAMRIARHVDVITLPGNHDPEPVFYLSRVLRAWFRNAKNVHIDDAPRQRKLFRWGNVAIMFTHKGGKGDSKANRNRLLMATEYRKDWGDARFCEIHTGDLHQVRLEEEFGVRVRILPSLCPPDAWHSGEGYVGNIRSAEAYVWNRDEGLIATATYNVPEQGPKVA